MARSRSLTSTPARPRAHTHTHPLDRGLSDHTRGNTQTPAARRGSRELFNAAAYPFNEKISITKIIGPIAHRSHDTYTHSEIRLQPSAKQLAQYSVKSFHLYLRHHCIDIDRYKERKKARAAAVWEIHFSIFYDMFLREPPFVAPRVVCTLVYYILYGRYKEKRKLSVERVGSACLYKMYPGTRDSARTALRRYRASLERSPYNVYTYVSTRPTNDIGFPYHHHHSASTTTTTFFLPDDVYMGYSTTDWKCPPNLRDTFSAKEIDRLLTDSIRNCLSRESDYCKAGLMVDLVARTGYTDEPEVDEDGKPQLRRTTALHHCAESEKYCRELVVNLFKVFKRFDVNYVDESGFTHFHVACKRGCHDVVERFLERGQDPDCPLPKTGDSPLHLAVISCDDTTKVVKSLLRRGANPNLANHAGSTRVHIIASNGHEDTAKFFFKICDDLQLSVDIDAKDELGRTALHWALVCCKKQLAEFLWKRGADLNVACKKGKTPLHLFGVYTDDNYYDDFIERFFEIWDKRQGTARVDAQDEFGNTPLHDALRYRHRQLVELLLRRGADPNLANNDGSTAVHLIAPSYIDNGDNDDLVEMFFDICDDRQQMLHIDAVDKLGNTPLHEALRRRNYKKVVESLLRRGANPNLINEEGQTPLHMICKGASNRDELLKMFPWLAQLRVMDRLVQSFSFIIALKIIHLSLNRDTSLSYRVTKPVQWDIGAAARLRARPRRRVRRGSSRCAAFSPRSRPVRASSVAFYVFSRFTRENTFSSVAIYCELAAIKRNKSIVTEKETVCRVRRKNCCAVHIFQKRRVLFHQGRKDYPCERCEKKFGIKGNVLLHIKTVHEGRKDYPCDRCDKKFGIKGNLLYHQKTVHEGRKDFPCNKCEKKFGRKQTLLFHQKTVHEGRKDYECKICEKKFGHKPHLLKHQITVHEGRKDFACNRCEKKFGHKWILLVHQKAIHEGHKDFACDKCEMKFGFQGSLIRHRKTVHEARKDYVCDKCEKKFGRREHFLRHQKTVHEGRKDYPCDKCEKKFGQKQHLLLHQKKIHEDRKDVRKKYEQK
ncbi:unnamed protein product [Trichogramma brassicae]|uniref:C2H2-type domain-containing protein n=1 Tax=Trichogramma brassicae TaxID=86971 RepID=A0A6H5J6R2_9HYME|nr:unnamed protein product [Trichogramma brassicae]